MGDGTEGRFVWRRPVRKADLELVLGILPHVYAINPQHHTLRQLAREVGARQAVPTLEDTLVEALKIVNDKVGFLRRIEPYFATEEHRLADKPSAWFYECVGTLKTAVEKVTQYSSGKYKTPLFGAPAHHKIPAVSLDNFA